MLPAPPGAAVRGRTLATLERRARRQANPTTIRGESLGSRRTVNKHAVLAVAALGVFMEFVDSTIVNIAFPSIHRSFSDTTLSTLS